jgi:hypothetical protein
MKEVDFTDCGKDDARWHKLNAAQQVAEEVMKRPELEPVAYRVVISGMWEYFPDYATAKEERLQYENSVGEDEHEDPEPLYADPVASQQAVAAVPEGYAIVPLSVTDEMIVAFAEEWYSKRQVIDDPDMADAYKAMLAVATQPAAAPSGDVENTATKD